MILVPSFQALVRLHFHTHLKWGMAVKLATAHDRATEAVEDVFKIQYLFTHFFLSATRTSNIPNGNCTISQPVSLSDDEWHGANLLGNPRYTQMRETYLDYF